jgi:hypothetical protein
LQEHREASRRHNPDGHLPSFDSWLAILIRQQDEVVRTLGLADELGLG